LGNLSNASQTVWEASEMPPRTNDPNYDCSNRNPAPCEISQETDCIWRANRICSGHSFQDGISCELRCSSVWSDSLTKSELVMICQEAKPNLRQFTYGICSLLTRSKEKTDGRETIEIETTC
jgi:hypothetical protein